MFRTVLKLCYFLYTVQKSVDEQTRVYVSATPGITSRVPYFKFKLTINCELVVTAGISCWKASSYSQTSHYFSTRTSRTTNNTSWNPGGRSAKRVKVEVLTSRFHYWKYIFLYCRRHVWKVSTWSDSPIFVVISSQSCSVRSLVKVCITFEILTELYICYIIELVLYYDLSTITS